MAPLLLLALAGAYALAIRQPPLHACGGASNRPAGKALTGIDLCNDGRWPLTLTGARVESAEPPALTAWVTLAEPNATAVVMASSAALTPDPPPHRAGPVEGWVIEPTRPVLRDMHGLRLEWPAPPRYPGTLVVTYRYLGWPFTLRLPVEWPDSLK